MIALGSIVKHSLRLDLGEGRVTYIHDDGRVNVEFKDSAFSSIPCSYLIDCTDEALRAADEKQKALALTLLGSGCFAEARKVAIESKFLVWSWKEFLDAERFFTLKFEKERRLRNLKNSMEMAERRRWESRKNKLQTALLKNKPIFHRSLIRGFFSLAGISYYKEGDVVILGRDFKSDFLFEDDEGFVAIVSSDDWNDLFDVSGGNVPGYIYDAKILIKCMPVSFLSSIFRMSKTRNKSSLSDMSENVVEQDLSAQSKQSIEPEKPSYKVDVAGDFDNRDMGGVSKGSSLLEKYASDEFFSFIVAGFFYYQGSMSPHDIVDVGDFLTLKREPDNAYDNYAVQVFSESGKKLGYVPKTYSKAVSQKIIEGFKFSANVKKIVGGSGSEKIMVNIIFS